MFKNKKIAWSIIGSIVIIIIALATFILTKGGDDSGKSTATKSTTSKVQKSTDNTKNNQVDDWWFKGNTYKAGNLKFKLGKSEVVNDYDGKKALVIHAKMTNVSDKEMTSEAMYAVVSAYQKTDTQNVKLEPAMVTDEPINTESHNLSEKLLPGKTVDVAILWNTVNDNDVTVKFENAEFKELGSKTYSIK